MKILMRLMVITMLIISGELFSQQLQCQVQVEMPRLQPRDQEELSDIGQKLTDYLNNNRWSESDQDILINCNVNLIVQTINISGSEKRYLAQFLISSASGENFYDQNCEFTYIPGQAFETFRNSFDPLLDLIDFYAFMVIAGELDTYELLSGTSFYNKAQDLANRGQLSNYATGWKNRLDEVILITEADHAALREAKYYYYGGLYYVEKEMNAENAKQYAKGVVERLRSVATKKPNSKALKRFFDSHCQEICKLFEFDDDRENIMTMIDINPSHSDIYRECEISGTRSR
jgi:hypothetical protein